MAKYTTKQRKILLECLAERADETITAKQIAELLSDNDISLSAVYRNLAELENDKLIRRVAKSGSREVFYQFSGSEHCKSKLHLSCKQCGKTYHMSDENAKKFIQAISDCDGFNIDTKDTILYGTCDKCKE